MIRARYVLPQRWPHRTAIARTRFAAMPAVLLSAAVLIPQVAQPQQKGGQLPPRLENYLSAVVRPTPSERSSLLAGQPIAKLLQADPSLEVAVFGGIWIKAPVRRYVEALQDIENFERGKGFRATKRISASPKIEDFAGMHLSAEDVEDLRSCRVGSCEVKLSEEGLRRFQTEIDWRAPDRQRAADAIIRQLALEYVKGYLEGGDQRLAVYRDRSRPAFVAQEFRLMVDQMPELTAFMPNLRQYLLNFPKSQLSNATSFLYWQEVQFGLKPTLRISHLTVREGPEDTVVASKMLYASHYFWTALELRALVPDPSRGEGFWFFTVNRSRSDGLSGLRGRLIRRRVRSGARDGTLAALTATKRKLEH